MTNLPETHIFQSQEKVDNPKVRRFVPNKSFFKIFLMIVLLAGLISATLLVRRNQDLRESAQLGNVVSVFISPDKISTKSGDTFTLSVFAKNTSLSVSAATVQLNFDPNILEIVSLNGTDYLPTRLAFMSQNGKAIISVGSGGKSPQTTSGDIVTAVFKVIGTDSNTNINLEGTQIAVTESDQNAANISGGLNISIENTIKTPSPYPTESSTFTPTPYPTESSTFIPSASPSAYPSAYPTSISTTPKP